MKLGPDKFFCLVTPKNCVCDNINSLVVFYPQFPQARHVYSLENFFTGGRCRLAWRVLTLADENYRGELHEILVKCFKNFVYP